MIHRESEKAEGIPLTVSQRPSEFPFFSVRGQKEGNARRTESETAQFHTEKDGEDGKRRRGEGSQQYIRSDWLIEF